MRLKMREDMMYVYMIEGTEYNEETHSVEYKLSDKAVYFDKGRAAYYFGFTNPFLLIGMYRNIFSEPCRSEVMQSAHKLDDRFIFGNQGFMAIWTGVWTPLEKIGFVAVMFNSTSLNNLINDIMRSYEENGKLVDRV